MMRQRTEMALGCLGFVAAALLLALAFSGCATTLPDVLAKMQAGVKTASQTVEPVLKEACVERARACVAKGIDAAECTPVHRCKEWVAVYTSATKALHSEAATLNRLWQELEAEGVIGK